jgi:hypothetical protein
MTLVACPSGSLSDQYVTLLGSLASYSVSREDLTLQLAGDEGEMGFNES